MSDGIPGVFMEERPITVDEACVSILSACLMPLPR